MKKLILIICLIIIPFLFYYTPEIATFSLILVCAVFLITHIPYWILKSKWYRRYEKSKAIKVAIRSLDGYKYRGSGMTLLEFNKDKYKRLTELRNLREEYEQI